MKFNYKFSNLLGTVYHGGNLLFSPDGNSVISPVGNRITIYDLENNKSQTLPFESQCNITSVALSPSGYILIAIAEDGDAILCSMLSRTVMHRYRFSSKVRSIHFSPNEKYFIATKGNNVMLFRAPGPLNREYNPFVLLHTFGGPHDETTCIDWSSDSNFFVVGSKDMCSRVYSAQNPRFISTIGGHTDCIVGAYFEENSLDLYTVSRNGKLCVWECDQECRILADVMLQKVIEKRKRFTNQQSGSLLEAEEEKQADATTADEAKSAGDKLIYKGAGRFSPINLANPDKSAARCHLTCSDFHRRTHMFVTAYSNGTFLLHEMPSFTLIHSLCITEQYISAVRFNRTGDWLALGCRQLGQLLVWEWQSETYILKQQGHFNNMNCLVYSPDGQFIATGGEDGKTKVWNVDNGFCVVTFSEHTSGVTAVCYTQSGKAIISASKDGTVRAFDLKRYRNFRTFTSPRPTQFTCLAVDASGEVIAAGGWDEFEIFLWSVATGHLMEVITGHEGPISSLSFSPKGVLLASGSADKSVRLWEVFSSSGSRDPINIGSEVMAVEFRPDGGELAVASLNGQLTFFDVESAAEVCGIEGRKDLGSCRRKTDLVSSKTTLKAKAFTTLCYSADGNCILAAGQSKNICIYYIREQILVKKFAVSKNLSFDGVQDLVNLRKMARVGNLALVEEREEYDESRVAISLPGVRRGDMASRHYKSEVRVMSVKFSPTGRCWAAVTTEGLLLYSFDQRMIFEPLELETTATTDNVNVALSNKEYLSAITMAVKLGEKVLIGRVIESVDTEKVALLISALPDRYVQRILNFLASQLESTNHVEFYMLWIHTILVRCGTQLKLQSAKILPLLHSLQKVLQMKLNSTAKMCDHNKFALQYLINFGKNGSSRHFTNGELIPHEEE